MERNNDRITSFQLMLLLIAAMIGVGILSLPREIAKAVGPDGWILIIIGGIITLLLAILMSQVIQRFPQKTFQEIVNSLVGRILGTIILFGFVIYFIVFSAFEARIFGEILKEYLLLYTPTEVLIITLLLTTAYAARSGVESIARLAQIVLPGTILLALLLILILMPELDFSNLLPVLRTPPLQIAQSLPIILFSFLGIELILIFSPFVADVRNITKKVSLSIGVVVVVYLLIVIISTARFGVIETTHNIWPGLEVFKTVDIPDVFIENIEIYALGGWIYLVFMTMVSWTLAASLMLSYLFRAREQNFFVLPTLPIIYYIALVPDNFAQINEYMSVFLSSFGVAYFVILPVLLWGISLLKKRRGGGQSAS